MPWTSTSIRNHNHSLGAKAGNAAKIANHVLESTGNEGEALATASKWAKKHKRAMGGPAPTVPTYQTAPVNVNSAGFVPTPQPGDFNLDLNTGATTSGTRSAIQALAQRGLPIVDPNAPKPAPAAAPAAAAPQMPLPWYMWQGNAGAGGGASEGGANNEPGGSVGGTGGDPGAAGNQNEGLGGLYAMGGEVQGLAEGGVGASMTNWQTRRESSGEEHTPTGFSGGLIQGPTGGRADKVSMNLPSHSHVIPALAVSGMGGGNTEAGAAHLNNVFNTGPFGSAMPKVPRGSGPRALGMSGKPPRLARGGPAEGHHETYVSHGEYVVSPEEVLRIGNGDYNAGHDWLDKFIKHIHKEVGRQATHAPPPVKER